MDWQNPPINMVIRSGRAGKRPIARHGEGRPQRDAGAIKAVFIARGGPTAVVEDLQASIDALRAASDRRLGGRGKSIGSNADLQAAIRAGHTCVAVLDSIISIALKNQPGLLAEWIAAKRVQHRLPVEGTEQPAPVTPPAGS